MHSILSARDLNPAIIVILYVCLELFLFMCLLLPVAFKTIIWSRFCGWDIHQGCCPLRSKTYDPLGKSQTTFLCVSNVWLTSGGHYHQKCTSCKGSLPSKMSNLLPHCHFCLTGGVLIPILLFLIFVLSCILIFYCEDLEPEVVYQHHPQPVLLLTGVWQGQSMASSQWSCFINVIDWWVNWIFGIILSVPELPKTRKEMQFN